MEFRKNLPFESYGVKKPIANELELTVAFAQFRDRRNTAATRRTTGGSNVASEASYWCKRRETSEIQAKAYSGQRGTRTRMRSIYTMCIAAVDCI